jgi:hypothetical protein
MKKPLLLFSAIAIAFLSDARAASATVDQGTEFKMLFDHFEKYELKAYTNNVLFRSFNLSEVTLVSSSTTNNTYAISIPGTLPVGKYSFTLSAIDAAGQESEHSSALTLTIRFPAPRNVRKQ